MLGELYCYWIRDCRLEDRCEFGGGHDNGCCEEPQMPMQVKHLGYTEISPRTQPSYQHSCPFYASGKLKSQSRPVTIHVLSPMHQDVVNLCRPGACAGWIHFLAGGRRWMGWRTWTKVIKQRRSTPQTLVKHPKFFAYKAFHHPWPLSPLSQVQTPNQD